MAADTQAYTYSGPLASVTLRVGDENLDVVLYPGKTVRLPAEHEFTQTLAAQKRLVAVVEPQAQAATAPGAASDTADKPRNKKGASQ